MNYNHFSNEIKQKLDSMYLSEDQMGKDSKIYPIDGSTRINIPCGLDIYNLCMKVQPKHTLEIGLAYGFSTLYFLEAQKTHKFTHTATDPAQFYSYNGIGFTSAKKYTEEGKFFFHEKLSFDCLNMLYNENRSYDIIFIDGGHRFDDVLCDFTLAAQICPVGGYIILDDLLLPSITKVRDFIVNNRNDFIFEQYVSRNLGFFKKVSNYDDRAWDHFKEF
jgi:cephalosporin hydroxylase